MKTALSCTVLVAAIALVAEPSFAFNSLLSNKVATAPVRITTNRMQAMTAAEQKVGGTTATGIENQDGTAIYYDITVDKAGVPQKVLVDDDDGPGQAWAPSEDSDDGS
jgi:hypothetical protein